MEQMTGIICDVCGLPIVPMGGEDICMDENHRYGYDDNSWREHEPYRHGEYDPMDPDYELFDE